MEKSESGFEEIAHTADWAMRVRAGSLPALFVEAARGMYALSGVKQGARRRVSRTFRTQAPDPESLLVAFLSELVWSLEQENLAFDTIQIRLRDNKLKASMAGAPILSINKSIKAVTYHNLKIQNTADGFLVEIVFDV